MSFERVVCGLLLAGSVAVIGCGRRAPAPAPAPQPETRASAPVDDEARRRAEEEARRRAAEEARAILAEMIFFDFDRADIRPDAQATLQRKLEVLRANPGVTLRIEGHADERGSTEYNLALGLRRANAAKQYLVGFGLDASRFETVTLGEERPLDPGHNEEAWAKNRRAEFHITAGGGELVLPRRSP